MPSLLEVVFENVVENNVTRFLMLLIAGAEKIVNVQCSEDIRLIVASDIDATALDSVLSFQGSVTVLINLDDVKVGSIIVPKLLLRLVKYGEQYDIDLNFDPNDLENLDMLTLVTELHDHARKIASEHDVKTFFGGIEPAVDEATRYFTNDELGPVLI